MDNISKIQEASSVYNNLVHRTNEMIDGFNQIISKIDVIRNKIFISNKILKLREIFNIPKETKVIGEFNIKFIESIIKDDCDYLDQFYNSLKNYRTIMAKTVHEVGEFEKLYEPNNNFSNWLSKLDNQELSFYSEMIEAMTKKFIATWNHYNNFINDEIKELIASVSELNNKYNKLFPIR